MSAWVGVRPGSDGLRSGEMHEILTAAAEQPGATSLRLSFGYFDGVHRKGNGLSGWLTRVPK